MKRSSLSLGIRCLATALILGILAHTSVLAAMALVCIMEALRMWLASPDGGSWLSRFLNIAPRLTVGLAICVAFAATGRIVINNGTMIEGSALLARQGLLTAVYAAFLVWYELYRSPKQAVLPAMALQLSGLWAIFLAATLGWVGGVVLLALAWIVGFAAAQVLLHEAAPKLRGVLAAAWALIVAECAWVFGLWLVNYVLFDGFVVMPQAALVLSALSYCFGSIYVAHARGGLSRSRLAEYLAIGVLMLIIVIAGTPWRGSL